MARKLDRAPRKTSATANQADAECVCKCKSPTDKNGDKTVPEADSSTLRNGVHYNIG
jgi:hypothetical protein